jgi:phosphate acyltransferase
MRIALDVMGGDLAPKINLEGALSAKAEFPSDVQIVLVGSKTAIEQGLQELGVAIDSFEIVHAEEVIGMGEHPTKAISQKQNSSIVVGYKLLATKGVDVLCSAGNTGAMLVGAMFSIKPIEGIIRPGIAGFIPQTSGKYSILLDVGANADVKPEVLNQFAEMGSLYANYLFGTKNAKVGLVSVGEEEEKGNLVTQAAHQLIKNNKSVNFVGNLEGRDILTDKADVIICDGFTGNVILKMAESLYTIFAERDYVTPFTSLFNWKNVGGSPILGVNGNVVIGHGSSDGIAIKNMLHLAKQLVDSDITSKIQKAYS